MGSKNEPQQRKGEKDANGTEQASFRAPKIGKEADDMPAWSDGLKELYRSVVDEPLPGNFQDLLDQFDETGGDSAQSDPENRV